MMGCDNNIIFWFISNQSKQRGARPWLAAPCNGPRVQGGEKPLEYTADAKSEAIN